MHLRTAAAGILLGSHLHQLHAMLGFHFQLGLVRWLKRFK